MITSHDDASNLCPCVRPFRALSSMLYALTARKISGIFSGWRPSALLGAALLGAAAINDAAAQLFVQPVHLNAKRVDRTADLFGQGPAMIAVQSVSFTVIKDEHLALFRIELTQAVSQAFA